VCPRRAVARRRVCAPSGPGMEVFVLPVKTMSVLRTGDDGI